MTGGPGDLTADPGSDPDLRAAEYVLGTLDPQPGDLLDQFINVRPLSEPR